jgi:hypothetical protein
MDKALRNAREKDFKPGHYYAITAMYRTNNGPADEETHVFYCEQVRNTRAEGLMLEESFTSGWGINFNCDPWIIKIEEIDQSLAVLRWGERR